MTQTSTLATNSRSQPALVPFCTHELQEHTVSHSLTVTLTSVLTVLSALCVYIAMHSLYVLLVDSPRGQTPGVRGRAPPPRMRCGSGCRRSTSKTWRGHWGGGRPPAWPCHRSTRLRVSLSSQQSWGTGHSGRGPRTCCTQWMPCGERGGGRQRCCGISHSSSTAQHARHAVLVASSDTTCNHRTRTQQAIRCPPIHSKTCTSSPEGTGGTMQPYDWGPNCAYQPSLL